MKTLIAVDDSKESWDAVAFAQEVLDDDDEIVVIDVARPVTAGFQSISHLSGYGSSYAGLPIPPADLGYGTVDGSATRADETLVARRTAEAAAGALGTDTVVIERGDPADMICATADDHQVDMIIVGTRDHGKVRRLLGGSVSRDVLDRAKCPVLVVK